MYQGCLYNNNIETTIHYPSSDSDDPHLNKLPLTEGLSVADSLSFSVYQNNPGFYKVFELATIVKVKDVRDESIRFTGRVLDISEKMDSDGKTYKDITCEGALSFLNDTKQRANTIIAFNPQTFLYQLLSIHNSKVESYKQIMVGSVDVTGSVAHTCEFKTTLAELLAVRESIGGEIRVREVNNVLYLDWLTSFSANTVDVILGTNMKDMVVSKDITSLGTRIIPLGANNLTIATVHGGLDYIEDVNSKNVYGVIEKTIEYKDIDNSLTLMNTCLSDLKKYTQPLYLLTSNALDLSYISGIKMDQFILGTKLHLVNPIMGIDDIYDVIQMNLDLLTPYDPKLTISNRPVTMTNTINDLRATSIQNNGVYNNVQIGSAFGIRAVRSDNKVITTINATDGISIENDTKKVFSVDIDGNIITNDITANDMKANKGTFTDIYAEGGEFNKITATDGILIEDGDTSCAIDANGIKITRASDDYSGLITMGGSRTELLIPDDLQVAKQLKVGVNAFIEKAIINNGFRARGDVELDGPITINGTPLDEYIVNLVGTLPPPDPAP